MAEKYSAPPTSYDAFFHGLGQEGRFRRTNLDGRNGFHEATFARHALGTRNSVSPAVRRRRGQLRMSRRTTLCWSDTIKTPTAECERIDRQMTASSGDIPRVERGARRGLTSEPRNQRF